jgi:hypothetical protein
MSRRSSLGRVKLPARSIQTSHLAEPHGVAVFTADGSWLAAATEALMLTVGAGSGGGGGGAAAQMAMNQVRQDEQRAQQRLNQAYQRAIARALKEATPKRVEIPRPAKLSDWNKLVSKLGDDVGQARDKAPPEQYRRAIEQYFSQISRVVAEQDSAPK